MGCLLIYSQQRHLISTTYGSNFLTTFEQQFFIRIPAWEDLSIIIFILHHSGKVATIFPQQKNFSMMKEMGG